MQAPVLDFIIWLLCEDISGHVRPVDAVTMCKVPSGTYLGASSAFLLCPLLFALVLFLNDFECPLTGRDMASHNRSTKLHKAETDDHAEERHAENSDLRIKVLKPT
eukprot:CAMPEP_0171865112 /NCGR_PEP_ID=MMETSP0992-20121227/29311_1 /TAXON_ID=483369 /ORGANISM="non described non described, Strain CCMP2098" /LENGTH=105 /DNA_ID=CAMNT_0012487917 /DNA_START=48 /DNA_END=361 /DNA_ORIENTATION=+